MQWVDTHVHWDAAEFDADREQALIRAKEAGVTCCFNPAVEVASFVPVQALADASKQRSDWPSILPAYGIHPMFVDGTRAGDLAVLDHQLKIQRPIAVGEIGLDGCQDSPGMDKQQQWFEAQLELAVSHELPVLLHVRHAVEAVIKSLKRVQGKSQKIPGGIAHAFNGSEHQANQLISMGLMLGFGGSLTYERSLRIRRLAATLPLAHIVLETDAPDIPPAWLNGARNEPAELPIIANTLASLREISAQTVAAQTSENARKLFAAAGLTPPNGAPAHSS